MRRLKVASGKPDALIDEAYLAEHTKRLWSRLR
jgi:hypothetical protein